MPSNENPGHDLKNDPKSDQDHAESPSPQAFLSRLLGLDIGSRRIGVAVSDELGLLASPVMTLYRKRLREDIRSIARLARRFSCSAIVVGDPLHLSSGQDGQLSPQAAKTRAFAAELGAFSGLPILLWDERLTTREAHAILYAAGKPRQEHEAVVDQVAAVLILQGYLDAQRAVQPPQPTGSNE